MIGKATSRDLTYSPVIGTATSCDLKCSPVIGRASSRDLLRDYDSGVFSDEEFGESEEDMTEPYSENFEDCYGDRIQDKQCKIYTQMRKPNVIMIPIVSWCYVNHVCGITPSLYPHRAS